MAKWQKTPPSEGFKGLNEVVDRLNFALLQLEEGTTQRLVEAANKVISDARDLAPLKDGALRNSGHVEPLKYGDEIIEVKLGFNAAYAAAQHEHTEFDHPKAGEAKFLEKALIRNYDRILRTIAGVSGE